MNEEMEKGKLKLNRKITIGIVFAVLIILIINIIIYGGNITGFAVISTPDQEAGYIKTTIYYTEFTKMVANPVLEKIQLCSKDSQEIICEKVKSKINMDEWNDGYYWYVRFSGINKELEKTYLELFVRSYDNKVIYFFYRDYFIGEE